MSRNGVGNGVIFLELLRRGYQVYIGQLGDVEVDSTLGETAVMDIFKKSL